MKEFELENINFKEVMIIMGSQSDWPTMKNATIPLNEMEVEHGACVVSAHRTPQRLYQFAQSAQEQGVKVIIAGAGGSAHLPGMVAAISNLPVVAVPVKSKFNDGLDSLLSIVQMPRGVAVATQGVGEMGAYNAGVYAAQILSLSDERLNLSFSRWRKRKTEQVSLEVEA